MIRERAPRPPLRGRRPAGRTPQGARQQAQCNTNAQPDPLKTNFGYIGADSYNRQRQELGSKRAPDRGRRVPDASAKTVESDGSAPAAVREAPDRSG